MSTFHFPMDPDRSLLESMDDIPKYAKASFVKGFEALSSLSKQQQSKLLETVLESFPESSKDSGLSSDIGVPESEGRVVFGAGLFVMGLIALSEEISADQLVTGLKEASLVKEHQQDGVLKFVRNAFTKQEAARTKFQRSNVRDRILPSFSNFASMVDVRLAFKGDDIDFVLPVAIVNIDTDVPDQELKFQLDSHQIQELIEKLEKTLRQLKAAEEWTKKTSSLGE